MPFLVRDNQGTDFRLPEWSPLTQPCFGNSTLPTSHVGNEDSHFLWLGGEGEQKPTQNAVISKHNFPTRPVKSLVRGRTFWIASLRWKRLQKRKVPLKKSGMSELFGRYQDTLFVSKTVNLLDWKILKLSIFRAAFRLHVIVALVALRKICCTSPSLRRS